jgi:hypothetical protein
MPPPEDMSKVGGERIRYYHQKTFHRWSREDQIPPPEDIPQVRRGRIRDHCERTFRR